MTKRIGFVIALAFLSLAIGTVLLLPTRPRFRAIASAEWKFKVRFPGKPDEEERLLGDKRAKRFSVAYDKGEFSLTVGTAPNPLGESDEVVGRYFDEWRDNIVNDSKNKKLLDEKTIKLEDKFPGREFVFELSRLKARQRVQLILGDHTSYVLAATGEPDWPGWRHVDEFFSSFRVLE